MGKPATMTRFSAVQIYDSNAGAYFVPAADSAMVFPFMSGGAQRRNTIRLLPGDGVDGFRFRRTEDPKASEAGKRLAPDGASLFLYS